MTPATPPAPAAPPERCPACEGTGHVVHYDYPGMGIKWTVTSFRLAVTHCPECAGTGQRKEKTDG